MPQSEPKQQFWEAVQQGRDEISLLIGRAKSMVARMPEFRRIDGARSQAERDLAIPGGSTRKDFEARQSEYEACWREIGDFTQEVQTKLNELQSEYREPDGKARKILSATEVALLTTEMYRGDGRLGGALPSTLQALENVARMIEDLAKTRRGYKAEIRRWMKDNKVANLEIARRRLGVGLSTLKSIMTDKGEKRYSDETLRNVLRKIGVKTPS